MTGVSHRVRRPESKCSAGRYVLFKRGRPDEYWEKKFSLQCFSRHLGDLNDSQVVWVL